MKKGCADESRDRDPAFLAPKFSHHRSAFCQRVAQTRGLVTGASLCYPDAPFFKPADVILRHLIQGLLWPLLIPPRGLAAPFAKVDRSSWSSISETWRSP